MIAFLLGCRSGVGEMPGYLWSEPNLVQVSYNIADNLVDKAGPELNRQGPILVASFVDVDNVQESSTLGRMMAEQIGSRLVQKNFRVQELKLRSSLFISSRKGEFLLSREIQDVSRKHDAQALVVGTYAPGKDSVYFSSRLVQADSGKIISSYDVRLEVNDDLEEMLDIRGF